MVAVANADLRDVAVVQRPVKRERSSQDGFLALYGPQDASAASEKPRASAHRLSSASIRSPIQRMTGTAIEFPSAL